MVSSECHSNVLFVGFDYFMQLFHNLSFLMLISTWHILMVIYMNAVSVTSFLGKLDQIKSLGEFVYKMFKDHTKN